MLSGNETTLVVPRAKRTDGRHRRADETKRKIIDAGRHLIFDANGKLRPRPPTVAEVAKEAGVSIRSVFQHYGDVKGLADVLFAPEEIALKVGAQLLDRMGLKDVQIPDDKAVDDEGLPVDKELRETFLLVQETKLRLARDVYLMHLT